MASAYRNLAYFFLLKFGLMYLMRVWIRRNLKDMEKRGITLPVIPK
jgi:hypothetical protein